MPYFDRVAKLVVQTPNEDKEGYIDEIIIENLRISFTVVKSFNWSGNTAIIKVWNLRQQTRNLIRDYATQVRLFAGYAQDNGPQVLFVGQAISVSHSYDQPEIVTTFECIDGDKYFNQKKGSVSYASGTLAKDVIKDLAIKIGVEFPTENYNLLPNLAYLKGFSYPGPYREAIFKVCDFLNMQGTIQNNILYVYPLKGVLPGPIFDVNENTGMHGIPERFTYRRLWEYRALEAPTPGYRTLSVLRPLVIPGSQILLTSTHLDLIQQPQRVETVRHQGDTYGSEWVSNIESITLPQPKETLG